MKFKYYFSIFFLILIQDCWSQSIVGQWKTIDDNSGEPRSIVQISNEGDSYFGRVIKIYSKPNEDPDPVCDLCPDDRKNQKVKGLQIIQNLKFDAKTGEYSGGTILDPENGNIYECKIWLAEDGTLKVRGYLYFFYRTQTWLPFDE